MNNNNDDDRRKKVEAARISPKGVEELLEAAQDEMFLNLSINSHLSRHCSTTEYLPFDLDRRFKALKSNPNIPSNKNPMSHIKFSTETTSFKPTHHQDHVDPELKAILGDDLSARFASLKASSLPSSVDRRSRVVEEEDDAFDEDDEVEKLILWAKDAARLDPSPSFDDDD